MDCSQELPEEMVREIVLRIPYMFHNKLSCVCKRWKAIIQSSEFCRERIGLAMTRKLVCLLDKCVEHNTITIYDPVRNVAVARSPPMPHKFQLTDYAHCICVDQKLIVIGLRYENQPTSTIMVYDFLSFTWRKGAENPIQKLGYQIACCASPERLVYVVGQTGEAAVYDVAQDKWELLPQMPAAILWARGYYINKMFYVMSVLGTLSDDTHRFDPVTQQWEAIRGFELLRYSPSSFVGDCGHIYAFGKHKVVEFDFSSEKWIEATNLPSYLNWVVGTYDSSSRENIFSKLVLCPNPGNNLRYWGLVVRDSARTTWSYNNYLVMVEI